jgi:hypothetical protein
MQDRYMAIIREPSFMILFRGRTIRTPAHFKKVTESELNSLKSQAKRHNINIEIISENSSEKIEEPVYIDFNKPTIVELEKTSEKTFLEKILNEEIDMESEINEENINITERSK